MKSDWESLFFQHQPHADQLPAHDERLLRDVGLTRLDTGELALAEDPLHLVEVPRAPRSGWLARWLSLATPHSAQEALRSPAGGK